MEYLWSFVFVSDLAKVKFVTKSQEALCKKRVLECKFWGRTFHERMRKCEENVDKDA